MRKGGLTVFLLCIVFAQARTQSSSSWREYRSAQGKFSILLPGDPQTGYRPIGTDSDVAITYVTNLIIEQKAWTVAYFDLPQAPANEPEIKTLFDQTRERMLKMYSLKLAEEADLKWAGYPTRAFKTKPDERNRVQLTRLILVKQRVYEIWALTDQGLVGDEDITKYFDSFRPTPLTNEEVKNALQRSQADAPKTVPVKMRVSSGVLLENVTKKVQPEFPAHLKTSGTVEVRILISEEGNVIQAEAISGHPILRAAAIRAVTQWQFKPTYIQDRPVKVEGVLPIEFKK